MRPFVLSGAAAALVAAGVTLLTGLAGGFAGALLSGCGRQDDRPGAQSNADNGGSQANSGAQSNDGGRVTPGAQRTPDTLSQHNPPPADAPTTIARNMATVDFLVTGRSGPDLKGKILRVEENRGTPVAEGQELGVALSADALSAEPGDTLRCKLSLEAGGVWRIVGILPTGKP
jgi:hypothetical protein